MVNHRPQRNFAQQTLWRSFGTFQRLGYTHRIGIMGLLACMCQSESCLFQIDPNAIEPPLEGVVAFHIVGRHRTAAIHSDIHRGGGVEGVRNSLPYLLPCDLFAIHTQGGHIEKRAGDAFLTLPLLTDFPSHKDGRCSRQWTRHRLNSVFHLSQLWLLVIDEWSTPFTTGPSLYDFGQSKINKLLNQS